LQPVNKFTETSTKRLLVSVKLGFNIQPSSF
jgi:hypothetical protein